MSRSVIIAIGRSPSMMITEPTLRSRMRAATSPIDASASALTTPSVMTSLICTGVRRYRSKATYAPAPMRHFALTAVGRDRPGIVSGITAVLLAHEVNVEDSQMTILRGHFTMMLIVAVADDAEPEPSHIVSVYGVDHPGIVHAVSSALAERGITITDLTTRLVGEADQPLYALMMEVAMPEDAEADVIQALAAAGEAQGLEVTVRPL